MYNTATKFQNSLLYRSIRWSVALNVLIIAMLAVIFDIMIVPNVLPNYVPILLFSIWFLSAYFIGGSHHIKVTVNESIWWIVIILWEIMLELFGFSSIGINNILIRIPIYCLPIIMSFVIRNYYYREKILLFTFLFLVILFNIVKNDITGYYNPWMFESLRSSDGFSASSSTFTAVTLFFFPVCFLLLKNNKPKYLKFVSVFSICAASYYFFVLNSRGISFFLFLLIILGFIFSPKRSYNNINPLYLLLAVLSLSILFYLFFDPFMNILRVVFAGNERLLEKFNNITDFSQTRNMQDTGSLGARIELSLISLQTWLGGFSNFFFGIGEHAINDASMQGLTNAGVGQHSQFFDHLARYGLLGGLILYKAVKNTLRFVLKRAHNTKMYNRIFVVLLAFILYSFLNNSLIGNILFVVFLVFPLIVDILESKNYMSYE
ncbi:MAG: O-antigen ligase family protein [Bacteroidales bacterium]|nr:O-antigen ligase family protein [Bacteroidales bacterium]